MREVPIRDSGLPLETESFLACIASILELDVEDLPRPGADEDAAAPGTISRWLGSLGLGVAPIREPASFSWPGPWIARLRAAPSGELRSVVMFGVPSGVIWDPADPDVIPGPLGGTIAEGYLIASADIALAMPPHLPTPATAGTVETICVAAAAGEPPRLLDAVRALPGRGLEGDRHVIGTGTFPSGMPGSALTLIEAEVCDSFDPPLLPDEHRRNLVTRGIDLNALVGRQFTIGDVHCEGMRLCEPCTVVDGYARRPVLRALVHRGGLRADILEEGEIRRGDPVRPASEEPNDRDHADCDDHGA